MRSSHTSELPAALEAHGSDATICLRRSSWPARCYTRRIGTFAVIRIFSISQSGCDQIISLKIILELEFSIIILPSQQTDVPNAKNTSYFSKYYLISI